MSPSKARRARQLDAAANQAALDEIAGQRPQFRRFWVRWNPAHGISFLRAEDYAPCEAEGVQFSDGSVCIAAHLARRGFVSMRELVDFFRPAHPQIEFLDGPGATADAGDDGGDGPGQATTPAGGGGGRHV